MTEAPRRISIFGATGSIGQNTLDLIRRDRDAYRAVALTGGRNVAQLAADAREFGAEIAVTAHEDCLADLRAALDGSGVAAAAGPGALVEAAQRPADWVMSAIVGAAGLAPGHAALAQGTTLALANKESMVAAGPMMLATAERYGSRILPVDSEHSALFQLIPEGGPVERVVLTASGGGLRDWPLERLDEAGPADAGAHPNWEMGQRITIDSASMFNKALEVIEARELFGLPPDQIEVVVHPQSIVHALVGFADGGMLAHLGAPDMRHAIGYALHYPHRRALPVARLDLAQIGQLDFHPPDPRRYPALALAAGVMKTGGGAGAVFNAAKEVALDGFLAGRLRFTDMAGIVEATLDRISSQISLSDRLDTLESVLNTDHLARRQAAEAVAARERSR